MQTRVCTMVRITIKTSNGKWDALRNACVLMRPREDTSVMICEYLLCFLSYGKRVKLEN